MKKSNKRRIVWIDRKIIHCTIHKLQLHEFKKKFKKQSRTFELDQKFCVVGTELDSISVS